MSITEKFANLCSNLRMSGATVDKVARRYKAITQRLNSDFRGINSETAYSRYVGSYGRGTAIHVSDIDMLYILPYKIYVRYNSYSSNGQSALLQAIKSSIKKTYPLTDIGGDGQVVKVGFCDDVYFEVVPCFLNKDNQSYTYPDSNNGGSWKITNPIPEIDTINDLNNKTNKNLKRLCRMARAWKDTHDVPMGGLLIDTLAHRFLNSWAHNQESFLWYDYMTRDFFKYLSEEDDTKSYWCAVGSGQYIYPRGRFAAKAKQAYNAAVNAISNEEKDEWWANYYWRQIYGTKF